MNDNRKAIFPSRQKEKTMMGGPGRWYYKFLLFFEYKSFFWDYLENKINLKNKIIYFPIFLMNKLKTVVCTEIYICGRCK